METPHDTHGMLDEMFRRAAADEMDLAIAWTVLVIDHEIGGVDGTSLQGVYPTHDDALVAAGLLESELNRPEWADSAPWSIYIKPIAPGDHSLRLLAEVNAPFRITKRGTALFVAFTAYLVFLIACVDGLIRWLT